MDLGHPDLSQQTFWSLLSLSTNIMPRIAWKVGEVVIIHLINTILMGLMRRMIIWSSTALGRSQPTAGKAYRAGYILGGFQILDSRLQRSAEMGYCKLERW